MSSKNAAQIAKLRAALEEILTRRNVFSHETYTQIILAMYDRIRVLQSEAEAATGESGDEIRLVTVMFIDILDSTQIAHQVEAEEWKGIISETYKRLGEIVRTWGGEVAQYLGDGILCFFGAHRSQEDDAVRAVSCGLAAQDAMLKYADELIEQGHGFRFAVRIGMSTGRVVVGMIGDKNKQEVLALGTPTNLAARLQVLAEPGKVLIDSQTYYRVRKHFATQAHPLTKVKGFDSLIEYYTVIGRRRLSRLTFDRIAGIEVGFVGRAREMRQITDVLERTLQEQELWGVMVSGELGVGKSRLLQEVIIAAEDAGSTYQPIVMIGEQERRQKAYSVIRSLLALRCGLRDDTPPEVAEPRIIQHICETWKDEEAEASAHVMGCVAGYGFTNSPHTRAVQSATPGARQIAYGRIARWFRALVETAPLLIAVDNVQWIDQESIGLLEYLAQELARFPVVILAAGRSGTPGFNGLNHVVHIPLSPLAETDIAVMIESVLQHVDGVPPNMREIIAERAEGNPLFVEEFLLMLFDTGVLEKTDNGRWRINRYQFASFAFNTPNNLLGLLQARLDELPLVSRRAMLAASVMGQTFWQGALAALLDVERHTLAPLLADLEVRGIIVSEAETQKGFEDEREYRFRHTLYPEVAYLMLTRPVRESYHRDVAAWLSERVSNHPDYLGVLAEHYHEGGQAQEALTTYLIGARDRYRRGLLRETLEMTERGQAAAGQAPREIALPLVSQLWMLQGQALEALDRYEESSAASQSALMLMDEMPPVDMAEERVIAARTLASAHLHLGHYDEAFRALNNAHSLLPKENVLQHAAILRTFGTLFYARGQLTEAVTFGEQALKLAQQSGESREIARVTAMLSTVALDRGAFADALDYSEAVLQTNRQQGNLYYQVLDLRQIATVYRCLFAYDLSMILCDEAEALQARIDYHDPLLKTNRALNLIALGQPDIGLRILRETAGLTYQNVQTSWRVQLALVNGLGIIGDYDLCRAVAAELAEITREQNEVLYGRAQLWLGIALTGLGDVEGAWMALYDALQYEQTQGGRDLWLCYQALSRLNTEYHARMADTLRGMANSLQSRPDLHTALINSPIFRSL